MPVAVPLSPGALGLGIRPHYNTNYSMAMSSVAEIKAQAIESVQRDARGATGLQLISSAKKVHAKARELEAGGNIQQALGHYIKVATLIKRVMESHEFQVESKGALHRAVFDFLENEGKLLPQHTTEVETKLTAMQASAPEPPKASTSIADRLRSLEESSGASITTTKRVSREPISPISPTGPHALVSPSAFSPDSPNSSPPATPDIREFNSAYPPIEVLSADIPAIETLRNLQSPVSRPTSLKISYSNGSRPASPRPLPATPRTNGNSTPPVKPILPLTGIITSATLLSYLTNEPSLKILIIDVRTQAEYDREHIKVDGQTMICIDPSILGPNADGMVPQSFQTMLPQQPSTVFANRDKFDLVVMLDASSSSLNSSTPLGRLERLIYSGNTSFGFSSMFLKNKPVVLVGGFDAWKNIVGPNWVIRGSRNGATTPTQTNGGMITPMQPSTSTSSNTSDSTPSSSSSSSTRPRVDTNGVVPNGIPPSLLDGYALKEHRPAMSLDGGGHSRTPADHGNNEAQSSAALSRRPAISRAANSISHTPGSASSKTLFDSMAGPSTPPTSFASINYPQFSKQPLSPPNSAASMYYPSTYGLGTPPNSSGYNLPLTNGAVNYSPMANGATSPVPVLASPPQASLNPSLSRRRSDFLDQGQSDSLSGASTRPRAVIDYPALAQSSMVMNMSNMSMGNMPLLDPTLPPSTLSLTSASIRPPPPAFSSPMSSRQDNRPILPPPVRIAYSDWPVTYWLPSPAHTSGGLKNLGNTCYINATMQCLSATVPFVEFFLNSNNWTKAINMLDRSNSRGSQTHAFVNVLKGLRNNKSSAFDPKAFCTNFSSRQSRFTMGIQQDSQEFLTVFLDEVHQDLNRVIQKVKHEPTAERYAELERLPLQRASEEEWNLYRLREDSIVVDFFQGQFRSRMECTKCSTTSTTYEAFSLLQLTIPPPPALKRIVTLKQCLDKFLAKEVMEKDDAWHCPKCKTLRRATKKYDLSRLPPILILQLVRFRNQGELTGKIETYVDYPLKGLDLTDYMSTGVNPGSSEDPRTQSPPYKYDLYGVANHSGNLSGGHYTAHVHSRDGWLYYNDSSVSKAKPDDVVSEAGYVLFYKRVKA